MLSLKVSMSLINRVSSSIIAIDHESKQDCVDVCENLNRISHSKRVESFTTIQKHSPQPRKFH